MEAASRGSTRDAVLNVEEPHEKSLGGDDAASTTYGDHLDKNKSERPPEEENDGCEDLISDLPAEIVLYILSFVSINDHAAISRVNKTFHAYSRDEATFNNILAFRKTFAKICRNYKSAYNKNALYPSIYGPLAPQKNDGAPGEVAAKWDSLVFCSEAMRELRAVVERLLGPPANPSLDDKKKKQHMKQLAGGATKSSPVVGGEKHQDGEEEVRRFILNTIDAISNDHRFVLKTIPACTVPELWPHCALLRVLADYLSHEDEHFQAIDSLIGNLRIEQDDQDEGFLLLTGGPKLTALFTQYREKPWPESSRLNLLIPEFLIRCNSPENSDAANLVQSEAYKHLNAERYEEAVFLFDHVLKTRAVPSADLLIDTARAHWGTKDWVTTAELYAMGIRKRPTLRAVCYADCGYAHLKARRFEEAVAYYETAIEKDPKLGARHWGDYGFVLFKLEEWARASEVIGTALEREPGLFAECYVNHGLVYHKLGDYAAAAQHLKVAIDRGVLQDSRAVPFLHDFLEIFEKAECPEYVAKCKAKLEELGNTQQDLSLSSPGRQVPN